MYIVRNTTYSTNLLVQYRYMYPKQDVQHILRPMYLVYYEFSVKIKHTFYNVIQVWMQTCLLLRFRRIYYAFFYSKLRPMFEPDYSMLEQTSFFQNSFVQKGTYYDWSLRET